MTTTAAAPVVEPADSHTVIVASANDGVTNQQNYSTMGSLSKVDDAVAHAETTESDARGAARVAKTAVEQAAAARADAATAVTQAEVASKAAVEATIATKKAADAAAVAEEELAKAKKDEAAAKEIAVNEKSTANAKQDAAAAATNKAGQLTNFAQHAAHAASDAKAAVAQVAAPADESGAAPFSNDPVMISSTKASTYGGLCVGFFKDDDGKGVLAVCEAPLNATTCPVDFDAARCTPLTKVAEASVKTASRVMMW
jgi:hypothetical protein